MRRANVVGLIVPLLSVLACDRTPEPAQASAAPSSPPAPPSSAPLRSEPKKVDVTAKAMGTEVRFVAYTTDTVGEAAVKAAIDRALDEIGRLERAMTSWRDDSEIAAINRRAGEPVAVGRETFEVIERSLWASQVSRGVFDVTFEVMSGVWKFGDAAEDPPRLPDPALVARLRKAIDYRRVTLDAAKPSVAIGKGQKLGLGGIAKGYIVDRAAAALKAANVSSFLVQAGGDLYGSGRKPDGTPWVSGIQDPRGARGEFFGVIELENRAFSTAGDYARAFVLEGKRFHHIIDPRTGYPATACRSVTVWAKDAFTADAVDDAVFILGPEEGLKLVESLDGVGAVIVDRDNEVRISKRLDGRVRILKPPTDGI